MDDIMGPDTTTDDRAAEKLTLGVTWVLSLAAAALVSVLWLFWIREQSNYAPPGEDKQRHVALAASLVLLSFCLVWLTSVAGSLWLRGLLAGFLSGLSATTCLVAAWAFVNSPAPGDPPDSAGSTALVFGPIVGMVGGMIGLAQG